MGVVAPGEKKLVRLHLSFNYSLLPKKKTYCDRNIPRFLHSSWFIF